MTRYRLHYFPESGNSYKLALMLTFCGQSFEPVWTDFFGGITRTAAWRATVNEMGEIPVLEEDEHRFSQTGAVLLRLAARYGTLEPDGGAGSYDALRWLLWDNHKLTSYVATYRFLRCFTDSADPGVLAFLEGRVRNALDILDRHLAARPFALGDRPTIIDLSLCGYLYSPASELGLDLHARHPAIAAWLERFAGIPGWRSPYDLLPGPRHGEHPVASQQEPA